MKNKYKNVSSVYSLSKYLSGRRWISEKNIYYGPPCTVKIIPYHDTHDNPIIFVQRVCVHPPFIMGMNFHNANPLNLCTLAIIQEYVKIKEQYQDNNLLLIYFLLKIAPKILINHHQYRISRYNPTAHSYFHSK